MLEMAASRSRWRAAEALAASAALASAAAGLSAGLSAGFAAINFRGQRSIAFLDTGAEYKGQEGSSNLLFCGTRRVVHLAGTTRESGSSDETLSGLIGFVARLPRVASRKAGQPWA